MKEEFGNNHGITFDPPEEKATVSLQERLRDNEKLSTKEMLQKYGIRLMYEVWDYIHENESGKKKNPGYFHD